MSAAAPTMLKVRGLRTGYTPSAPIVNGVDFDVESGKTVAVIGPNGAGKSTVLKAVAGLLPCWEGSVELKGKEISRLPTHERIDAGLAFVPQGRVVFPFMTVVENLDMGGFLYRKDHARMERSRKDVFELFPRLADRRAQAAGTMSGGEQQMLAIGRGLMTEPELLIMDEPSLGLSPQFVQTVFESLTTLKERGLSILLVEQKVSTALNFADYGYVLVGGKDYFHGPPADILGNDEVKELYLGQVTTK